MTTQTTDMIDAATPHSGGAKVNGGIGSREPHGFTGSLWEAHPLWKEILWMDTVNKVHGIQFKQGFLRKVSNQVTPEEPLGKS